jgi:hypothetical protein
MSSRRGREVRGAVQKALSRRIILGSFTPMLKPMHAAIPLCLLLLGSARPLPIDPDTRAWWATTAALSSDAMAGRDTGSEAYERAAKMVAQRFAAAGLVPQARTAAIFSAFRWSRCRSNTPP